MAYGDFKDLTRRRTASDKILSDKAFNISKNSKYDGDQRELASMVYKFCDKKSASIADKSASCGAIKKENMYNKELTEELHKPIIKKFKKRKIQSPFIHNISGTDLSDMQLLREFDKGIRFLLCVIDIFSKYSWVIPLKDKNGIATTDAFKKKFKRI